MPVLLLADESVNRTGEASGTQNQAQPPMKSPTSVQIYWRFALYLLWEFRWALTVFTVLVLGGGLVLKLSGAGDARYSKACFEAFLLIFLQVDLDSFPEQWYLQPAFFLVPIIGIGAVADSIVRLAYLVFAQKSKLPEWQRMMASLYRDHIIVVGAGRVGVRIIKGLATLREPIVVIERLEETPFLDEIQDLRVPVICGDGRQKKTLEQAGASVARAIILASDDDLTNLDAALTARDLNPQIRVVLRLYDDTLAEKFASVFHMPAISTSRVAAPAFIAAATDRKVYTELQLEGEQVHLVDVVVRPGSSLVGRTVGQVQSDRVVNIVMHRGPKGVQVNPSHEVVLGPSDTLLVIAEMDRLLELDAANLSNG
jgi:voltage-gated potassium channel